MLANDDGQILHVLPYECVHVFKADELRPVICSLLCSILDFSRTFTMSCFIVAFLWRYR